MDSADHALRPHPRQAQESSGPAEINTMRQPSDAAPGKLEPNKKVVLRSAAAVQATGIPENRSGVREKDRAVQFLERVRMARAERRGRQRAKRRDGSRPLAS
eukprot:3312114-Amphidinium_carterae.2